MPKIIVTNMDTEQMSGRVKAGVQNLYAAKASWRMAWFAEAGDIIITSVPMKQEFLAYIGRTIGFDPSSVLIITLNADKDALFELSDDELLNVDVISQLRQHIANPEQWTILPYYYTEAIAEIADLLGMKKSIGQQFAAQRGCDLLNRKTQFRQIATGARLPIASGSIADTPQALARAIRKHLPFTGAVIVKKNNESGGAGNIALTQDAVAPLPGARKTYQVLEDIEAIAIRLWEDLTDQSSPELVVESYHNASHIFCLEYLVQEDGTALFLNSATFRLTSSRDSKEREPEWIGFEIPADLPAFSYASALTYAAQFVMVLAQIGYRGPLNIDAILTTTNEILFTEVNGRLGGESILHCLGERLLGKTYADNYVVASLSNVKSPALPEVLRIFQEQGLSFNPKTKEGILILSADEFVSNSIECLLIGASRDRIQEMQSLMLEAIEGYILDKERLVLHPH